MPSHIFLQLGMWPEAAASNETAWRVSDEWVKSKNLALGLRDYHSYFWLTYGYLQQGRYSRGEELVNRLRQTAKEHGADSVRYYYDVIAAFIVETERWDLAARLFGPEPPAEAGDHAGH